MGNVEQLSSAVLTLRLLFPGRPDLAAVLGVIGTSVGQHWMAPFPGGDAGQKQLRTTALRGDRRTAVLSCSYPAIVISWTSRSCRGAGRHRYLGTAALHGPFPGGDAGQEPATGGSETVEDNCSTWGP